MAESDGAWLEIRTNREKNPQKVLFLDTVHGLPKVNVI